MKKLEKPPTQCPYHASLPRGRPVTTRFRGAFHRACDGTTVRRFICDDCGRTFSEATSAPEYRQRKRDINEPLLKLLTSNNSMRRAAILIGVARKTVDHRLSYYAKSGIGLSRQSS